MDAAEIEVFLVLATELHFGHTAERLRLPKSQVSRLIARLERRVGGSLFDRTSRRVTLTPLGQQLLTELQPAWAQAAAALDSARRAARGITGLLRAGFTNTTEGPALGALAGSFEAHHSGCGLQLREIAAFDPYTALRAGEIDVLVNWLVVDEPDLTAGPVIGYQGRMLAVAAGHPLAAREQVSVEDLAGLPVAKVPETFPAALTDAFFPPCTPSSRPIPRTHLCETVGEIWALVARGLIVHPTVASMAGRLVRDDIVLIPIADLPAMPLGLIWCTAHENARIRALASTARHLRVDPPA
jgi:DNA-binding transcriptional LysR family regulator